MRAITVSITISWLILSSVSLKVFLLYERFSALYDILTAVLKGGLNGFLQLMTRARQDAQLAPFRLFDIFGIVKHRPKCGSQFVYDNW